MKIVGSRHLHPDSPVDYIRRAERIIAEANRVAPHIKPRGFVVKAKTWQHYTDWRLKQDNPRLW